MGRVKMNREESMLSVNTQVWNQTANEIREASNSKFEKSGGISGGQRVKWLKHKIKKVLPAIKDKIGSKSA
jgi:hypothetical protein